MFNMGGSEILVILVVALIVLGPQQLPKAMRTFGNVMGEIRKVSSGFQAEMRSAMDSVTDTTATEHKPQSGSMAAVTPDKAPTVPDASAPGQVGNDGVVSEVVARNEESEPSATAPGADDPPAPAIDPADRAAG